jgi:hypothetical protein
MRCGDAFFDLLDRSLKDIARGYFHVSDLQLAILKSIRRRQFLLEERPTLPGEIATFES